MMAHLPYPHDHRPEFLNWYKGKRFFRAADQSDPDPANWVTELEAPGTGDPVVRQVVDNMRSATYDASGGTCLVGTPNVIDPLHSDWTTFSLSQAQTEWNTIHGRASLSSEVW